MNKVLFRVDDGPGIGSGHLMRCLAIAEEVNKSGGSVYLSTTRPSSLHKSWARLACPILVRDRVIGSSDDLVITSEVIDEVGADWFVIDGYGFETTWIDEIALKTRTLYVDDCGSRDPAVDILLNHNPGSEYRYAGVYKRSKQVLLGPSWFLIRQEFRLSENIKRDYNHILVTLGGEDPDNRVLDITRGLNCDGRTFSATIVSSQDNEGYRVSESICNNNLESFCLYKGPIQLSRFLRKASVVICGGGVTAIEAICSGAAPVVMPIANNQSANVKYLGQIGAVLVASGTDSEVSRQSIDLLHDETARNLIVRNGSNLVDRNGAHRVVTQMKGNV